MNVLQLTTFITMLQVAVTPRGLQTSSSPSSSLLFSLSSLTLFNTPEVNTFHSTLFTWWCFIRILLLEIWTLLLSLVLIDCSSWLKAIDWDWDNVNENQSFCWRVWLLRRDVNCYEPEWAGVINYSIYKQGPDLESALITIHPRNLKLGRELKKKQIILKGPRLQMIFLWRHLPMS